MTRWLGLAIGLLLWRAWRRSTAVPPTRTRACVLCGARPGHHFDCDTRQER